MNIGHGSPERVKFKLRYTCKAVSLPCSLLKLGRNILPQHPAQGLFLDLDGTLADSMPVMTAATDRFLKELGLERMGGGHHRWAGRTPFDIMGALKEHNGLDIPVQELVERYYKLVDAAYTDQATVMPGGRRLLAAASQRGCSPRWSPAPCARWPRASWPPGAQGNGERGGHRGGHPPGQARPGALPAGAQNQRPQGRPGPGRGGRAYGSQVRHRGRSGHLDHGPRGAQDFPRIAGVAGFINRLDQLIPCLQG